MEQKYSRYIGAHSLKFGGRFVHNGGGRTNPEVCSLPTTAWPTWKLVLNLGLRYDFFSKMVARSRVEGTEYGFCNLDGLRDSNFAFGPPRSPNDPYNSDGWVNLGPRLGFSYDPTGNSKTSDSGRIQYHVQPVCRRNDETGGGISHGAISRDFQQDRIRAGGIPFPHLRRPGSRFYRGKEPTSHLFGFRSQHPESLYGNVYFGVQHSLSSDSVLETAFVGNRGIKYPLHRVFNQVDRMTGLRPNPSIGEGYYVDNSQSTIYYILADIASAACPVRRVAALQPQIEAADEDNDGHDIDADANLSPLDKGGNGKKTESPTVSTTSGHSVRWRSPGTC
jgi:hypothetical protein